MRLSIIVAMDDDRLIGKENGLPWRLPADLAYFKQTTLGKTVLMGRNTYQSIGKPLPNRRNVVISHDVDFQAEGCEVLPSIDSALQLLANEVEVMVIGGASLYAQTLAIADRLYITEVEGIFEGDTYFPEFVRSDFEEVYRQSHQADEKNPYNYDFVVLDRR